MDLIQAIILGLVQGLTEFLPISSSGHVFLVPALFGWKDAGSGFTAVIQIGTLLAVFIYFWKDLVAMAKAWTKSLTDQEARKDPNARLGWGVILGTIPVVIVGLLFEDQIDTTFRSPYFVAGSLIGLALLLWASEAAAKQLRNVKEVGIKDAVIIGLWQCLALIPGSSRSGSTITGGLFLGLKREAAARYSFLLSVPAVGGSGLYKLYKEQDVLLADGLMPTLVATVVAFVSGYWAISFLIKFLQTRTTMVFVWYRVALGLIVLGLAFNGFFEEAALSAS
jgi:undecaprenyl-diphosphatase